MMIKISKCIPLYSSLNYDKKYKHCLLFDAFNPDMNISIPFEFKRLKVLHLACIDIEKLALSKIQSNLKQLCYFPGMMMILDFIRPLVIN